MDTAGRPLSKQTYWTAFAPGKKQSGRRGTCPVMLGFDGHDNKGTLLFVTAITKQTLESVCTQNKNVPMGAQMSCNVSF